MRNTKPEAVKPVSAKSDSRVLASLRGSQGSSRLSFRDTNSSNNAAVPNDLRYVPVEMQDAILDLLETCKENDIEVPPVLGSVFMNSLSESRRDRAATIMSFEERLVADQKDFKEAVSESPLVLEVIELMKKLKKTTGDLSLRVKNGSFKVVQRVSPADKDKSSAQRIETVFNGAPVQGVWSKLARAIRGDLRGMETKETYPIKDVNLIFEQGKTFLVLGGPRSGKSTLLRMIAGILPEDKEHEVCGEVILNRFTPKSEGVVWSNLIGYIDQIDRLHPYMTVKETCEFAWQCRMGSTHKTPFMGDGPEIDAEIKRLDEELYTVMTVLRAYGLTRVKDTFVGDQQTVRGVSGGEKKRVTVAEMSVANFPVFCMDEISTGLDAATTFDICKLLGEATALSRTVKIVSLLQPPPETFALFDELILLSDGKVIYSGPVEQVVPHFESLGYELPDRMDPADWLQALPTKDGAGFLRTKSSGGVAEKTANLQPKHLTNDEFHQKFYESDLGKTIIEKIDAPFEVTEKNKALFTDEVKEYFTQRYRNSGMESLKLLVYRECLLWWRDKAGIKARIMQDLVMGIIAGTVFWQGWQVTTSVLGILFQSMFFISLGAMLKVAPQYAVRGIVYKHQDANFFPTWTYIFGRSLATIPSSVIDGLLYGSIVYWFVGLAHNNGASFANYIIFVLITTCASIGIGLMFSIFSAVTKDRSSGQAIMSVSIVLLVLFSGFTVQPSVIPKYWIWLYWINIFAWAFRGLAVNEFQSGKYDSPSQVEGLTEGELVLTQLGFVDSTGKAFGFEWAGYSILFSLLVCVVSVIVATICLSRVRFATGKSLANDAIEEKEDNNDSLDTSNKDLPFQRVNLTFSEIHYFVTSSITKEKLELLKGIDGVVEAGKMTALMGSSGAGKTTLMDCLSLRKTSGEITGDVRLNGHPQEELSFRRCTGYVEQFDTQSAQLTIRETCEFSAKLRLESTDPYVTTESMAKFIDQTLDMLELTPIQNFLVGSDATGGLSFEQRKRLSIAVELVANPSIIFLDEPTSGLDARAASIVMRGLKRIALSGRAVCATIHQPSIAIFNSFDSLLLLKRGGEVVFYGDLGEDSCNLITYFQSFETTPLIQPGENPATWMLTTIGAGSSGSGNQFDYAGAYAASSLHASCLDRIGKIVGAMEDEERITFNSKYATTTATQIKTVMARTWKVYWRSPSYNRTRIIMSTALSILIGSIYVSNRVPRNESDMNSRVTTIYMSFLLIAVFGMNTVLAFFEAERNMYYRHKTALMYDVPSMMVGFTLAEIPFLIGTCLLYTTFFYFMIGFAVDATKYFFYYLFMFLCMSIFTFLGQMFVALVPDAQIAQGLGGLFTSCTALFTGVLIRPSDIPTFWVFMYWILPGHYVLEGLLVTQFNGDNSQIEASNGSPFWQYLDCDAQIAEGATNCFGSAEDWVKATFEGMFTIDNLPTNIGYLVGLLILTRIIAWWALGHLNYRKT